MFCDDRDFVRVMNEEGMKSVLCAGNGISQEPRALAEAGFDVVALDISPQAIEIAQTIPFSSEAFEFFCEPEMRRPGGRVEYVRGDMLDSLVCPGPFDLIIERSAARNYLSVGSYRPGSVCLCCTMSTKRPTLTDILSSQEKL